MSFLGILKGVTDFFTGNSIVDKVMDYFPPSMSEKEKAELAMKIKDAEAARDLQLQALVNEAIEQFNQRIRDLEGTAKDLLALPIVGRVIIFLRGCQRPLWGFAALYFDWLWLFNKNGMEFSDRQETALIVVNVLVLGFLFGERAVKNLMPLIMKILENKKGAQP